MAHITSIAVTGLAGRTQIYTKNLHRHLNVFFGPNGSGKTSLLKLIDSAMNNNAASVATVPFETAEIGIYTIDNDRDFSRSLSSNFKTQLALKEALVTEKGGQEKQPDTWATSPPEANLAGLYRHRFLSITRFLAADGSIRRLVSLSEEDFNEQFAKGVTDLWRRYSANFNAEIARVQQSGLAKIFENVLLGWEPVPETQTPKDPETAYRRVKSFLGRSQGFGSILPSYEIFSERYAREPRLHTLANEILEIEKQVEVASAPKLQLQNLLDKMFARKSVILSDAEIDITTADKLHIGLEALSSGEKQLIRIFVETLLAEKNTILIDEPEISMHIDWQRALLHCMRELNPNCQIIVATHSPEIMAEIPDANIFEI